VMIGRWWRRGRGRHGAATPGTPTTTTGSQVF